MNGWITVEIKSQLDGAAPADWRTWNLPECVDAMLYAPDISLIESCVLMKKGELFAGSLVMVREKPVMIYEALNALAFRLNAARAEVAVR